MRIHAIVTGAVLLLTAGSVSAQSTAFTKAANGWLNGDEVQNLQTLSDLAHKGDTDAQLVLGQIDRDTVPGGFSDYLANLPEADRDLLLRSGKPGETVNWLRNLSDPELAPLGEAIFYYRVGRDPIGNALALQKNGEYAAAEFLLWDTLNNGRFDLVNSIPADNYGLSNAGFLNWLKAYVAAPNKALTVNRLETDTSPKKIMGLLAVKRLSRVLGLNRYFSDQVNQLILVALGHGDDLPDDANLVELTSDIITIGADDQALNIVVRACDRWNGDSVDYDCIPQAIAIVGGYKTLLAIRTPAENAISSDAFFASNRPVEIFENLVKTRSHYYKRPIRSTSIATLLGK